MTQSHIKFAPLILPRKTPAEELREAMAILESRRHCETYDRLEDLAARLETPDAPKRWDGVFPWVAQTVFPRDCRAYFAERLSMFCDMEAEQVVLNETHQNKNQSPYHDGVIITITAGDGTEFPRVEECPTYRKKYLCLGSDAGQCVCIDAGNDEMAQAGRVDNVMIAGACHKPLPPGTVTRIVINNTLPTTEERYSVEVVEAENPKFPHYLGKGITLELSNDFDKELRYRLVAKGLGDNAAANVGVRQLREALAYIDHHEQPATVAVAEGLPLEMVCAYRGHDKVFVSDCDKGLRVKVVQDGSGRIAVISPADEARLRNLLNQRHADGKGGAE